MILRIKISRLATFNVTLITNKRYLNELIYILKCDFYIIVNKLWGVVRGIF